jgi:toxin-antitoxin system PIN domain toxin
MIVPDVNLLMYAHNVAAPAHARARRWWEELIQREQPVGLAWAVVFGFIRLATHASVLAEPLPPLEATAIVRGWMDRPSVRIVEPGPRHLAIVEDLLRATAVAGSLTTDTHLAALAIEYRAELCSNDADFGRFPGLRWKNPLRAA